MSKYTSEVEAVQWFKGGDHPKVKESLTFGGYWVNTFSIENTLGGARGVRPGDWILQHPNGDLQVVIDRLFKATYTEVADVHIPR